jgi:hypothetical protein
MPDRYNWRGLGVGIFFVVFPFGQKRRNSERDTTINDGRGERASERRNKEILTRIPRGKKNQKKSMPAPRWKCPGASTNHLLGGENARVDVQLSRNSRWWSLPAQSPVKTGLAWTWVFGNPPYLRPFQGTIPEAEPFDGGPPHTTISTPGRHDDSHSR